MLIWQILIDGFAISSLYALGATGFTLIFGVTGVLNLSHGAIMVAAAVAAWAASGNLGAGAYLAAVFGVVVALLLSLATYYIVVRRLQFAGYEMANVLHCSPPATEPLCAQSLGVNFNLYDLSIVTFYPN